jgi:methylenetetrahydrofolate reductase (NADPH)
MCCDALCCAVLRCTHPPLPFGHRSDVVLVLCFAPPAPPRFVKALFGRYYSGSMALFPWSESAYSGGPALAAKFSALIAAGMLPVNGQLSVNGADSSDNAAGWGGPDGRVNARSYVEAFVPVDAYKALLPKLQASGVSFLAATKDGACSDAGGPVAAPGAVSAVAWGVFPGREVVQPYVLDAPAFRAWAAEAFALWGAELGGAYEEGSATAGALAAIADSHVLVAVLVEDFEAGDAFAALA